MHIRPYDPKDRDRIDYICLKTGDSGQDATGKRGDDQLLSYIYALPYVDYAPEWAWVVEGDEGVVGYIIAVPDVRDFQNWWNEEWTPVLLERFPEEVRASWPEADQALFDRSVVQPKQFPEWIEDYPAELHIDILPQGQGGGFGRKLVNTLFEELSEQGVPGLALGVGGANTNAIAFYKRLGFDVLATQTRDGQLVGHSMGKKV